MWSKLDLLAGGPAGVLVSGRLGWGWGWTDAAAELAGDVAGAEAVRGQHQES